jgi:hypothetical protein
MRTRIALVAIVSIAFITVSLLGQLVSIQPARAATPSHHRASRASAGHPRDRLTSLVTPTARATASTPTGSIPPFLSLGAALLDGRPAGTVEAAPVAPTDTVTPAQRAAWERVAMCEEGGNWRADGSRFSGGLGITRSNWGVYGGLAYASEGALASPDQQIMVAERIQASAPDQYGCRGW